MKSPFTGKEMQIVNEWRKMTFRKEEYRVLFHFFRCEDTGEQFEDDLFARLNYNQLVNQYREKHKLPFPDQIKATRAKYGLSALRMSEILGFGPNGYRQYENGEVPIQSNAKLIQIADDPQEFKRLVGLCATLTENTRGKTFKTVDRLLDEEKEQNFVRDLERYFFSTCQPAAITGYKEPNMKKFGEMVVYFAQKLQPWVTQMNKLLFYADFTMHSRVGNSISGSTYRAIPLGPVPNNFKSIFEYLSQKKLIDVQEKLFPNGNSGERINPIDNVLFDSAVFTDIELEVLKEVADRFKSMSTKEIVGYSHREKAWVENQEERKLIDYNYSFSLNA